MRGLQNNGQNERNIKKCMYLETFSPFTAFPSFFICNLSYTEHSFILLLADYVGFIKKVMKLLQHGFKGIRKVEVTLTQLEQSQVPPPTRPCEFQTLYFSLYCFFESWLSEFQFYVLL